VEEEIAAVLSGDGEMVGIGDLVNEPSLVGNFFRHS